MKNILFITWDGPQTSYLESLFLPIFKGLEKKDIHVSVLQFTWASSEMIKARKTLCESCGVNYRAVKVVRKPSVALGSFLTSFLAKYAIRQAIVDWNIDIVMPRSTMPALACSLALQGKHHKPTLFDADGLPLDERVDFSGMASQSLIYRILSDVEAQAVRSAVAVITRSAKAVEILHHRAGADVNPNKFFTVTNGRDAQHFKPIAINRKAEMRAKLGLPVIGKILVYAGSLGGKYCLIEMLQFFKLISKIHDDCYLLILTGSPGFAEEVIQDKFELKNKVFITNVLHSNVPDYLACADLGLAFIRPSFSMKAASAIKLGEYLLCGLPVVATEGVGDMHMITNDFGFLLKNYDNETLQAAADWFSNQIVESPEKSAELARSVGLEYFSLEATVEKYLEAIKSIKYMDCSKQ